ncbi:uncharacterized protein LOC117970514 isoform X2 [Acipenser ruthenus]|uniref:uncharacterized protein LOC117970514 isoform X2 n=1 Tax=Acipenser ruthenus TaxID=7906 RepID=UPI0027416C6F|nr:uncharacterized protein LOC117970514 isoform X2 [Acipenser ruthenus]
MIFSEDLNKLFRNELLVLGLVYLYFQPTVGGTEIRAVRGNGVWINCTFDPARMKMDNVPVSWYLKQGNGSRRVQYYENGVDHLQDRAASRRGRVYPDKFRDGNASLFIENVQMSDEGLYKCVVVLKDGVTSEITVLTVLASSEPPQLTEALDTRSFTCSSRNGFPPALVTWTGGSGMNYTLDSVTQHTLNPEGLYDVVSKLTRNVTEEETICCTVWNQPLQEHKTNCMRVTPGQETDDQHIILIASLILVTLACVGFMIYWYLSKGRRNLARKQKRISNCSDDTAIILIGKPKHGVPSLINSCVFAYKAEEPFANWAGAEKDPPHYAQPEEVPLTERITITRALLQQEDRFWTSERDSYLDKWRREEQSHRRPFVFVHSCTEMLTTVAKDEIKELFEDIKSVMGSHPFTGLTKKNQGHAEELMPFFHSLGSKRVFSFHNYTIQEHKRTAKRDEEFLDFMNACIEETDSETVRLIEDV